MRDNSDIRSGVYIHNSSLLKTFVNINNYSCQCQSDVEPGSVQDVLASTSDPPHPMDNLDKTTNDSSQIPGSHTSDLHCAESPLFGMSYSRLI